MNPGMSASARVTNEQVIEAYRATGSVWKAAKQLGIVGQSVWERLRALDYPMASRRWTADEVAEMRVLAERCSAAEIAQRLGRPFAGVACKMSELGIFVRRKEQRRLFPALKRGAGVTRDVVKQWARDVLVWKGTIRQFALSRGVQVETVAQGLQRDFPDVWDRVVPRLNVPPRPCPQCGREYIPATARQKACSRACTSAYRIDHAYFGGKRSNTIGLAAKECQLCQRKTDRGLSSHHLIGKENDPENALLVALCSGCHQLIGTLAARTFVDANEGWERLIEFVMLRRLGGVPNGPVGFHTTVDVEWLTTEDVDDYAEMGLVVDAPAGQPKCDIRVWPLGE